jgi:hypothetical protein
LACIPEKYRLGNDPWFVMKRENVLQCLQFTRKQSKITEIVCNGGYANESFFAIVLKAFEQLEPNLKNVISASTHLTDWSRMTSTTSPHLFKDANERDIRFIEENCKKNNYIMFIRKVGVEFPNEVLKYYIYEVNREKEKKLYIKNMLNSIYYKIKWLIFNYYYFLLISIILYIYKIYK